MMRNRTIVTAMIILMGAALSVGASPSLQVRMFGASGFAESPGSVGDVADEVKRRNDVDTFAGITTEFVIREFGLGLRYQARYAAYEIPGSAGVDAELDWWNDWKSDIFVSFHPFGSPSFLDPYVTLGLGVAFRTDLEDGTYYDDESASWVEGNRNAGESLSGVTAASMYQYVGVGGQIHLGGLVAGAALNYNLANQAIQPDGYEWNAYPTDRFEVRVYGGVSIGAR